MRASRNEVVTHRQGITAETPHGEAGGPEGAQARREEVTIFKAFWDDLTAIVTILKVFWDDLKAMLCASAVEDAERKAERRGRQ